MDVWGITLLTKLANFVPVTHRFCLLADKTHKVSELCDFGDSCDKGGDFAARSSHWCKAKSDIIMLKAGRVFSGLVNHVSLFLRKTFHNFVPTQISKVFLDIFL